MKELLQHRKAETDKGIYTIIDIKPYIAYKQKQPPEPQFGELAELTDEYGLEPVNKVPSGGALWFRSVWGDKRMEDFVSDCSEIGCFLQYAKDAKALQHDSGWYLRVEEEHLDEFEKHFKTPGKPAPGKKPKPAPKPDPVKTGVDDPIISMIKEAGFEYADKRDKNGSLWIVAGEEEAKELIEKCKERGVEFIFAPNGGKATKNKPGWYSR